MITIVEFLNGRLNEDEAEAQQQLDRGWYFEQLHWMYYDRDTADFLSSDYSARFGEPERVMAEVAAKRLVIAEALFNIDAWSREGGYYSDPAKEAAAQADMAEVDKTLGALAGVYANHPDYRQGWRQ